MENGSLSDGLRNLKIFTAPWDHKGLKHIIFLRKRAHVVGINWVYSNSGSFSGTNPLMMILHTLARAEAELYCAPNYPTLAYAHRCLDGEEEDK